MKMIKRIGALLCVGAMICSTSCNVSNVNVKADNVAKKILRNSSALNKHGIYYIGGMCYV